MKASLFIISIIMILNILSTSGQIKSNYTPFEYSADKTKTICISEYQLDSLKYEILYYKDLFEETKRQNSVAQKTNITDTVVSNSDSIVINYYTQDRALILKKVYEYKNSKKSFYFLNEDYFLRDGKISYNSRSIISDFKVEKIRGKMENLGSVALLQSRSRYVYNKTGILLKVVVELRIGGSGIRLSKYTNDKKINQNDFHNFPHQRISIWEFWD